MVGNADAADKAVAFKDMTSTVMEPLALEVGEVLGVEGEARVKRYSSKHFCTPAQLLRVSLLYYR